ncbi:glutaredoxin family protein [Aggregicoccus sp. 17bor-14]|uniref:glutaredoxin family protein n=1 Tax=Myxococcaceae TaxID=31 RepID=UPI00129C93A9|nr:MULTISPECIES: glutaredoxin family protein [Myxococcaceae]MBF5040990.1 glutaredoxin family protein [Simulacricoccus sp. 17bor-14]MRI86777.1 glutaredoxin family protein [Aggregicoccus sp. 17bor-14]
MELSYVLEEQDLADAQLQLTALRRDRLIRLPLLIPVLTVLLALALAPVVRLLEPRFEWTLRGALDYGLRMASMGALVYVLRPLFLHVRGSRRLDARYARRMARAAARRSTFGPVSLQLSEAQLVRRNASGELHVAWARVKDLLFSPQLLTVRIDDGRQVLLLPRRALPDAAAFASLRERVEQLSGQRAREVDVERGTLVPLPAAPRAARRVHPSLLALLVGAALLLVRDRTLHALDDPRRGNPADHVIVYGTDWCPVCARLRTCLQRANVPFEDKDVDHSPRAEAEWAELDGRGVPVTVVGQRVLRGLDPAELRTALAEAGYAADCERAERTESERR